ncbi:MAG: hypothetical protein L0Y44_11655 [Phycisphaerales bacterium]|nr:hypothetical protein [Phycisphaerales bacterium]MCI0631295.1 hypothetical protein [Phycisphaerales bacterium]MCI0677312.1 hypothetical protein [Phycisphaerales bacterium]
MDASRLHEPHRFVNLITTLKALLSTGHSELQFQLAIRAAWLLHPSTLRNEATVPEDARPMLREMQRESRVSTHDEILDLYKLRSDIVHGGKIDYGQIEARSSDLLWVVRSLFRRILEDPLLFDDFMDSDENNLKQFLKRLALQG